MKGLPAPDMSPDWKDYADKLYPVLEEWESLTQRLQQRLAELETETGGSSVSTEVNNRFSNSTASIATVTNTAAQTILSGLYAGAGVLKTLVDVEGSGRIDFLSYYSEGATSMSRRLVLTLDGVVVFDSNYTAGVANTGQVVCGITSDGVFAGEPLYFAESCLVEISQGSSGTNQVTVAIIYSMLESV